MAHDVAPTLNAHFGSKQGLEDQHINGGCGHFVAHALRGEGFDASEDGTGRGTPIVPVAFPAEMSGTQCASAENLSPALSVKHTTAVAFAQNQRDEVRTMDVAGALAAEPGMKQQTYLAEQWAVRRLTPVECERLQGFPDGYTDIGNGKGGPTPDGPRYKALGNSFAVNVVRWIGRRIEMVDKLCHEPEGE